jgi:hypothetical protein
MTPRNEPEAASMSHSSTELLIDYWRQRKGAALAPLREAINPADFATLLPQVFILGREGPGDYRFRLAGGLVADLHARDLRTVDFVSLWTPTDRLLVQTCLEQARRKGEPLVVAGHAHAGGKTIAIEVLLAPLANRLGEVDRMIGMIQPMNPVGDLRDEPVERLSLERIDRAAEPGFREPANEPGPRLRLATVAGRLVG